MYDMLELKPFDPCSFGVRLVDSSLKKPESAFTPKWCFGIMTMWLVGLMTGVKRCILGHWSHEG